MSPPKPLLAAVPTDGNAALAATDATDTAMAARRPAADTSTIEAIRAPVLDDIAATDAAIVDRLSSDVPLVNEISSHIINSGGKRLRPLLVLLAARAAGYTGTEHHTLAAVIEFIHTATLLHDDVVDGSSLRRGRATANVLFGSEASVLVGDFLYSRAFQMMVDVGAMDVMRTMADTTNCIAEGEVLQLQNRGDAAVTEERYFDVIQAKTARLFSAAASVGAGCSTRAGGGDFGEALGAFGHHLGTAYQLVDDVLDYRGSADAIGKNLGDDLAEGKATLPLIRALSVLDNDSAAYLRRAIEDGDTGNNGSMASVVEMIERAGGTDYTMRLATSHVASARDALAVLPSSAFRDSLDALVDFAASRQS